jgi:hypothetical protein
MPNHVKNILTILRTDGEEITDEEVRAVREAIGSEEQIIDFNRIIPRPAELDIDSDTLSSFLSPKDYQPPGKLVDWINRASDHGVENFCKAVRNYRKYGHASWYSWSIEHWGTKWNAYSLAERAPNQIVFQTAWSPPIPVYSALSAKFPAVTFDVQYADEDIGSNCGHVRFIGGQIDQDDLHYDKYDSDARFACKVWGHDYEEYLADHAVDD